MQEKIHIILDSVSCAMETDFVEDPRVHIVRLVTSLEDEEWRDGDKTPSEMMAMVERTGKLPKTSQPAIGELIELYSGIVKDGNKAIFITLDSGISGTYQTACTAAQQVMDTYKGSDVRVIDSRTAALPITAVAKEVLAKADAGCSDMDELENYAKDLLQRTRTFFTVDTLDFLQKGGRIGKASALLGSIFGIRPILSLDEEGKVIPIDKCRTRRKTLQRLMDIVCGEGYPEAIYVCGYFCDEDMAMVAKAMQERYPGVPCESSGIGTVLLSHLGPGVLGLFMRVKK